MIVVTHSKMTFYIQNHIRKLPSAQMAKQQNGITIYLPICNGTKVYNDGNVVTTTVSLLVTYIR